MKETIEHHSQQKPSIKKGNNDNVNNINIKNSINLGDLIKKLKEPSKRRKKRGGGGGGGGGDQMIEQIQGEAGMTGQAGVAGVAGVDGINATPNQPFPSSSNSTIPSYMSNTTIPNQAFFPSSSNSTTPSYVSNTTIPQTATELEKTISLYEDARKEAENLGITIPESLKRISSSSSVDPNNMSQLKTISNELKNDTQAILNLLPSVPQYTIDKLYSSSSNGKKSLENITSGLFPPTPSFNELLPVSDLSFNIPPTQQEKLALRDIDRTLRLKQEKIEKAKNDALKENPRDIEKIKNIDNDLKNIRQERGTLLPVSKKKRDNNSTQSGLDLERTGSTQSVSSAVSLLPKSSVSFPTSSMFEPLPYNPPSINELLSSDFSTKIPSQKDIYALKNDYVAPPQTLPDRLRERRPRQKKQPLPIDIYTGKNPIVEASKELRNTQPDVKKLVDIQYPQSSSLLDNLFSNYGSKSFLTDVKNARSANIPPQSSLLDTITTKPVYKPPQVQRNLLGQGFSAFSNFLSGTHDAREAGAYGGLALGAVQPELLPAIGLAETGNQALNIIETPVNAIERAIQTRIDNPKQQTYRTDTFGQHYDKRTNKPIP